MDLLDGKQLTNKEGRVVPANQALKGKTVVAFYFSAHWCPPCRQFTPLLATAYQNSRLSGKGANVEVIFVSSDRSEADQQSYMRESHGNWFSLPYGDPAVQSLSQHFGVRGIPALKIVALNGGTEITSDGRQEIMAKGAAAFSDWEKLAPAPLDVSCVKMLLDNDDLVKKEAKDILVKLLGNIVNDPNNMKYRQVKLSNKKIQENLLPASGAFEILFSVGFEEADDKLLLPLSASLITVGKFLEEIKGIDPVKKSPETPAPSVSSPSSETTSSGVSTSAGPSTRTGPSTSVPLLMPDVLSREKEFEQRLINGLSHMNSYERTTAQEKALAIMPVDKFEIEARKKLDSAKSRDSTVSDLVFRDLLLLEFKEWFKTDFFKWVDKPKCDLCGSDSVSAGMCVATSYEKADGAGRVEGYTCSNSQCGNPVRFPRYHAKPEKLLETKEGRCGEWANCFVLCCRALGFDTRHVHDWTDHVWAEVWSEVEGRWLHVDPGETVDKPLVYEAGWGKKLTYVIACSKDEIQDVTWRYSKNHKDTRERRKLVRPKWLTKKLLQLSTSKQSNFNTAEVKRLTDRRLAECLEMLTPRQVKVTDKVGRQTGSLAWRLARGEMGEMQDKSHVFSPIEEELELGVMTVEYDCAEDKYFRGADRKEVDIVSGLLSGTSSRSNVARKVESDWDKVYVARIEGNSEKGTVSWQFSLSQGVSVGQVELMVGSTVFSSGRVVWTLCGGDSCIMPQPGIKLVTEQLTGSKELTLTANMSGGESDSAWQHTQLFRCPRSGAGNEPQMKISIKIKKSV